MKPPNLQSVPKVSVITIFLNAEKYLEEAVQSVVSQTYKDWELILVDDGSTDKSTVIALDLVKRYAGRVFYYEHAGHANCGMSASRNAGIESTRGEYVAFLDADDVWLPNKLEDQVSILDSYPTVAMVCGRAQWWYSWTGKPEDADRDFLQQYRVSMDTVLPPPTLLLRFLEDWGASPCDLMVRRSLVQTIGGYEESFKGMYEDQVFHAKICLHSAVYVSSHCWYRYRQHENSCCSMEVSTGQYRSRRIAFYLWLQEYLERNGRQNCDVWKFVARELWQYHHPLFASLRTGARRIAFESQRCAKSLARNVLPPTVHTWMKSRCRGVEHTLSSGSVRFGELRRLQPISQHFGFDRGLPIDRYYIENFLSKHTMDIKGHVLEIANNAYTRQFGGDRVTKSDVLHVFPGNPNATIVADLTSAEDIPSESFDCIILTQTLQFIYDIRAAIKTLHRILKPDGVLLTTFPGISKISREDMETWGEYWRFTTLVSRKLFEERFPSQQLSIQAHGNVLTAACFLHGLATTELRKQELDYSDPNFELLITVRAMKPGKLQGDSYT